MAVKGICFIVLGVPRFAALAVLAYGGLVFDFRDFVSALQAGLRLW